MNAGRRAVKMQTLSVLRTALTFHFNIPVTVGCPQVPALTAAPVLSTHFLDIGVPQGSSSSLSTPLS